MKSGLRQPSDATRIYMHVAKHLAGLKPASRASYRYALREWCQFLGHEWGSSDAIDAMLAADSTRAAEYRDFISRLPGIRDRDTKKITPATPGTVRKKLAQLKSIYAQLQAEGMAPRNPFYSIRPPSISRMKRPINMLPFSRVMDLVNAPGDEDDRGIRNSAILAFFYGCGRRKGDAERLRVKDLRQTADGTWYLVLEETKGGTREEPAIPNWAAQYIARWRARRLAFGAPLDAPMFCSFSGSRNCKQTNRKMAHSSVWKMHRAMCERIGLPPEQYSTHSGRATAVSKLRADKVDVEQIQKLTGHKSPAMIQLYDKRFVGKSEEAGRKLSY